MAKKTKGTGKGTGKGSSKGARGNEWADHLTQRAKAENYPARSVYKLEEIQKKFKVILPKSHVLDLGCAPGSWLLYAAKQTGSRGRVFGIDLKQIEIKLPDNVIAIQDNILALENEDFLEKGFGAVLSDMAPATTGRKDVDAFRSFELCSMALDTAKKFGAPNSNFVCKIFQGNEFKKFEQEVKLVFRECKTFKPESCRKQSKEIYIIAKGKK